VNDLDGMRLFAVAYLRHEQELDLKAFGSEFDNYYRIQPYTSGKSSRLQKLRDAGKTYEHDGALWSQSTEYGDDRPLMRKATQLHLFVPDVAYHITKWERGFQKVVNIQGTTTTARSPGWRLACRPPVWFPRRGFPDLRVCAHHGCVSARRRRGEDSKRAGSYVTLRDLIEWTRQGRGALLPAQPQARYRVHLRCRSGGAEEQRQPGVYVAVRPCPHLSVLRPGVKKDGGDVAMLAGVDLSPLQSPQARPSCCCWPNTPTC